MKLERIARLRAPEAQRSGGPGVTLLRYGSAIVVVALATLARLSLDSWLGQEVLPFSFLYLAVAVAAWWVGFRPALLALVLGLVVGVWTLVPPRHSLGVRGPAEVMEIIVYLVVTGGIVCLIVSLRKAREKAQSSTEAALRKQGELELEIHQRKQMEAALRQSEARFRVMAETVPDILFTSRPDGWTDYANPRFYAYTGLRPGTAEGFGWAKGVHPADAQRVESRRSEGVGTRKGHRVEYRLRGADGKYRWFLERCRPVLDDQGGLLKWVGACTDIDDQKRNQEALEQKVTERTAKLQELVDELEHFSHAIVHDMRAPLRSMQSFAELIEEEAAACLPPQSLDYLRRIRVASERMDRLIQDSLNYSRAVRESLPLAPVNLGELLRGLFETYPNLQEQASEIHLERPLPGVLGNEAALTQCFSNLLDNAVRFVAPGCKPYVRIRAEAIGGTARVCVEDNGIGIPPQIQRQLFGIFQRHNPSYGGTGIGLAIVRKLAERMGGRVSVESEPGRGSRFWLELPLAEPVGEQTQPIPIGGAVARDHAQAPKGAPRLVAPDSPLPSRPAHQV
jgi:PAS domain S-box-containing protein